MFILVYPTHFLADPLFLACSLVCLDEYIAFFSFPLLVLLFDLVPQPFLFEAGYMCRKEDFVVMYGSS